MKSEYRQIVESIISQESKLAEASLMHAEAVERLAKTAEWVAHNEVSLKGLEDRLTELEAVSPVRSAQGLQDELREINASLKFLCREVMRPEV